MRPSVCKAGASNAGRSLCVQISRERSYPLPIYWYHSKGNWLRYNIAADSFHIMKLCSRLFVQHCRNCPKDDKFRYFIRILRKLGGEEPWLMARWKARVEFLLSVIMVALWNRADHYIFMLWFVLLLLSSLFSSTNLSRRRLDVCHTSTHGVALVRI